MKAAAAAEAPPLHGPLLWQTLLRRGGVAVKTFDDPAVPGGPPVLMAVTILHLEGDATLRVDRRIFDRPDLMARHGRRVEAQMTALARSAARAHRALRWLPWLAAAAAPILGGSLAGFVTAALEALEHWLWAVALPSLALFLLGIAARHAVRRVIHARLLRMAAPAG